MNKSGTSSQIISLPQGGGALHGMGETFSPDLHTGTGNFTVPITVPAGRNGFQPQLSLGYSTGNGNGPYGLGWNLSVPGVARQTDKGIPRYRDADPDPARRDVFVLSGVEDLVPVPGGADGTQRYRPRTEGSFACIEHMVGGRNDYWRVRTLDGVESRYGTAYRDPPDGWKDPAVISHPADPG